MKTFWITCFILFPIPAWAADETPSLVAAWAKMIIALLLVLALILLLYALSRKGFGFFPAAKTGTIKILEMRSLGPKKGLCLIRVREEEFLLGLGGDRVELISRITRPQTSFAETLQTQNEEEWS